MAPETERDVRISRLLDEVLETLRAGHTPDVAAWKARYPDLADEVPSLLDTLRDLDSVLECWKAPSGSSLEPPTRVDGKDEQHLTIVMEPLPERIGRYRILRRVGSGGMGTVYQAHDPELDRAVAVKVPRFDVDPDHLPVRIQRFLREARAAARIEHPNVCHIHDVGEHDGRPYVVMAYVDGASLADVLRHEPDRYKDPADAVRLCRDVADALDAVHANGTIHRDLKPGNILIDRGGRPLLTDFGLARVERDPENLSADGTLIGTPAYMPPEQAAGEAEAIGPPSDVYSLGVVLYRLLTGKLPFTGSAVRILWKIGNEKPPAPSSLRQGLDPGLEAIVVKAMSPAPAGRYQSAREFREALDGWLGDASTISGIRSAERSALKTSASEHPTATFDRLQAGRGRVRSPGRRWAVFIAVAGGILLAGGLMAAATLGLMGPKSPNQPRVVRPRPIEPGQPLSPLALVQTPQPLKDARSWTLELRAHRGFINALAYSPDGELLATAGGDGTIRLWDRSGRRLHRILWGHTGVVTSLAWSPDGTKLASGSWDRTVRLWDVDSGHQLSLLETDANMVNGVAWSPDAKFLASADAGGVRLWDLGTEQCRTFDDGGRVNAVAWSPDGRTLASASADGTVRLRAVPPGEPAPTLDGRRGQATPLAWSPDGKVLAFCGRDDRVRLWDVGAGSERASVPKVRGTAIVLAWSHDGKALATGSSGGWVGVWDGGSGEETLTFPATDRGATVNALAWSRDDQTLASGSAEGHVRLSEAASGREVATIMGHELFEYSGAAWSPDGRTFATKSKPGVFLWDTAPAQPRAILPELDDLAISALAWSPDGKFLTSGNSRGAVSLWECDHARDRSLRTFGGPGSPVQLLAWSPRGDLLASVNMGSQAVQLWEVPSGRFVRKLEGHTGVVVALAWSSDGTRLASAGGTAPRTAAKDGTVRIWDVASGRTRQVLDTREFTALSGLAWSSDGGLLAYGGPKDFTAVWDFETRRARRINTGPVYALAWSPDGKALAASTYSASGDEAGVQIRQADTARVAQQLRPRPGAVYVLAWSPDGKTLATNGPDGLVRFWEPATGRLVACVLPGPDARGLVVSADGHYACRSPMEQDLVYVAETERGQEIFTPAEFARRYGWKNDPERVCLRVR